MRRISLLVKKYYKGAVFALFVYSIFWYGIGQYVKTKVEIVLAEHLNLSSLSYKSIDLSGYPFSLEYQFSDVKLAFKDRNNVETTVFVEQLKTDVDLFLKNIDFYVDHNVILKSSDNKKNHIVKVHQGIDVGIVMYKSFLRQFLFSSKMDTSIQKITYSDFGYDIFDKNIGKVSFVSRGNKFSILKSRGKNSEGSYRIKGVLHTEVGYDSSYKYGNHNLEADIEYRFAKNMDDDSLRRFYIKFHKFDLAADDYAVKVDGELGHDLITKNSLGDIGVNIQNFDGLIKACGNLLYKSQVSILRSILLKMAHDSDKKTDSPNITFSIVGHERGIKYGKIGGFRNIILFMMQAGELYDSISK